MSAPKHVDPNRVHYVQYVQHVPHDAASLNDDPHDDLSDVALYVLRDEVQYAQHDEASVQYDRHDDVDSVQLHS